MFTKRVHRLTLGLTLLGLMAVVLGVAFFRPTAKAPPETRKKALRLNYQPRKPVEASGFSRLLPTLPPWRPDASLEEIGKAWDGLGRRAVAALDQHLAANEPPPKEALAALLAKAEALNYEGQARRAYQVLEEARGLVAEDPVLAEPWLYTLVFFQGVTALRCGEDDNCVLCRGESSCIFPIAPAAVHANPWGSRRAAKHFTEYLEQFPDDRGVRWLLTLARMTLGQYPDGIPPQFRLGLDHFLNSEFDIGRFRDIGHLVGVNRLNMAGGAIMDDFDNDGLLDIAVTTWEATRPMALYRNKGDGTFEDRTRASGLAGQLGGLYCVQTDYNNDGHLDIFICRGAWLHLPVRPSLLRNNGDGTFTDVTREAGLLDPVNSISATWADYDNDGFLDLFICCERQTNRLYRNRGDGTFEEVAHKAGVSGSATDHCKGAAWIDYDNDGYPDLFVTNLNGTARLFHNDRKGAFTDVTAPMGLTGPRSGFSCWAWDFDNDGWIDLFATSYARTLDDVVKGLEGKPHGQPSNRLYRNLRGKGFQDVTREAGLDLVFATMGSNFADFDNDGYLDFYLGTGDPNLSTLVPNRLFKNVGGKRFADVTASSGTGHLQKGHAVACGDWDRNGTVDLFIQTGGVVPGDRYHNVLFQNPGRGNNWLTVKLVGKKTNRAALGARIKAVTAGDRPLTVHRHVSSGSSFGGNPLEQTLGLGTAGRVALLEITWPTSRTTQTFRNVAVNQAIEVTEFAPAYRKREVKPLPLPK